MTTTVFSVHVLLVNVLLSQSLQTLESIYVGPSHSVYRETVVSRGLVSSSLETKLTTTYLSSRKIHLRFSIPSFTDLNFSPFTTAVTVVVTVISVTTVYTLLTSRPRKC